MCCGCFRDREAPATALKRRRQRRNTVVPWLEARATRAGATLTAEAWVIQLAAFITLDASLCCQHW